ncbi:MAG: phosphoketolase family protein [Acholeplasmatales bacterium]|nr:phosphoketolase family protein [Acholeplasmatales bacterium]
MEKNVKGPLTQEELVLTNKYWNAANYLAAAQLYLLDNPLLERPLVPSDIKKKIVGHWGTVPGQNFIYVHLNRIIKKYDQSIVLISGPGHGGNFFVANAYLESTYSEVYPNISEDKEGLQKLFKQFSFPGGISSHVAPETPGSIHEGGELGYSLAHSFGAVLDNPDLITACVVGDGEAETGPLATSWQGYKFINPKTDGAVLPILHLNGYKIANPTILSRMPHKNLEWYFRGLGYEPIFVEGSEPMEMHQKMAAALEKAYKMIKKNQRDARVKNDLSLKVWPMIILRSPKGWTGPKFVDGKQVEGYWRAHQVPIDMSKPEHLGLLEEWLRSYHPEELFTKEGKLRPELKALCPRFDHRISANPHTNGGKLLKDLRLPDFRKYAFDIKGHGAVDSQDMTNLGEYIRDVVKLNPENFRFFGPDETNSNRLGAAFEVTDRMWESKILENDDHVAPEGRVMDSMLSEHMCEGMLEGYLLTGRHGFFASYEAFMRIVDSMVSQHAKWLKICNQLSWRAPIASLNLILASTVWQQDHNGFTHQDPGFIDHMVSKKPDVTRIYLPPDSNTLIATMDHCLRTKNYINTIVASKHPRPQWLTMEEAIAECNQGLSIWQWASNDQGSEPDVVMVGCGETPTLEALAATQILRENLPEVKVRFVNVIDLFKLKPSAEHPHGLTDIEYDSIFTKDKPIVFAFHGYPTVIHELTYRRHNRDLHVRGYQEEGSITTPFDMRVQNKLDRFHLVIDALNNIKGLGDKKAYLLQKMRDTLVAHKQFIDDHGEDLPEVRNWKWNLSK